jgi:hypothetical protein
MLVALVPGRRKLLVVLRFEQCFASVPRMHRHSCCCLSAFLSSVWRSAQLQGVRPLPAVAADPSSKQQAAERVASQRLQLKKKQVGLEFGGSSTTLNALHWFRLQP